MGEGNGGTGMDMNLEQCLNAFQQREELSQEDWVYCPKTKDFEKSLKKLDIWNLPRILVIHLKRFGRETIAGPPEKIDSLVQFPFSIDMAGWVQSPDASKEGMQYNLYAVVNHSGSMGFGHYTAYAQVDSSDGQRHWFHFNDSSVSRIEASQVVSKAAYI